jgi:hypothetical protein
MAVMINNQKAFRTCFVFGTNKKWRNVIAIAKLLNTGPLQSSWFLIAFSLAQMFEKTYFV